MMISNTYLMIFAMAMTGCVLATPLVTWLATWVGAIDRPDQFRRIHKGAIPRLGGLALALGRRGRDDLDPTARPVPAAGSRRVRRAPSLVAPRGGAHHPDRRLHRRYPVALAAGQTAGPGPGGADLVPGGHPDPDDRRAGLEPRPGVSQRPVQRDGLSRSSWRCPAWSSPCSGSWAA